LKLLKGNRTIAVTGFHWLIVGFVPPGCLVCLYGCGAAGLGRARRYVSGGRAKIVSGWQKRGGPRCLVWLAGRVLIGASFDVVLGRGYKMEGVCGRPGNACSRHGGVFFHLGNQGEEASVSVKGGALLFFDLGEM
jgi:hypothetical protein